MPTVRTNKKHLDGVIVVKEMRDYSNEPFFVKKKEDAIAFLKERGLFNKLTQMPENKKSD